MPWLHALENESFRGQLKIGYTDGELEERVKQLSVSTSL